MFQLSCGLGRGENPAALVTLRPVAIIDVLLIAQIRPRWGGILDGEAWLLADTYNPDAVLVNTMTHERFIGTFPPYPIYPYHEQIAFLVVVKKRDDHLATPFYSVKLSDKY